MKVYAVSFWHNHLDDPSKNSPINGCAIGVFTTPELAVEFIEKDARARGSVSIMMKIMITDAERDGAGAMATVYNDKNEFSYFVHALNVGGAS